MNHLLSNNRILLQKLDLLNKARDQMLVDNSNKLTIVLQDARNIILEHWKKEASKRVVVGIGGFPASGKTTAAKTLVCHINDIYHLNIGAHLPMDGFHFSNEKLADAGLESIKGDIATYDITAYIRKISEFKRSLGSVVMASDYIREEHEVFENQIEIGPSSHILVTEGIYVGYTIGEWGELRKLLDIVFYLDTSPEQCADRIVSRNIQNGRDERVIERKLSNDFSFMATSIQTLRSADYILKAEE